MNRLLICALLVPLFIVTNFVATIPIALFITINFGLVIAHELSHYLAAKICGMKIIRIRVFPHILNGESVLGSVIYINTGSTNIKEVIISQAPQATIIIIMSFLLFVFSFNLSLFNVWFLVALGITFWLGLVEFINGFINNSEGSDLQCAIKALSCSPWTFYINGSIILIVYTMIFSMNIANNIASLS